MENNVVTLETAKKLKAAGFPQTETVITWQIGPLDEPTVHLVESRWGQKEQPDYFVAAPTAQEIADQLNTQEQEYDLVCNEYGYGVVHKLGRGSYCDTMAEALGLLWLKLAHPNPTEREKQHER